MSQQTSKIEESQESEGVAALPDPNDLSLEQLVMVLLSERLQHLQARTEREFLELKDRQEQVSQLHKILKRINNHTSEKGELNFKDNEELKNLIESAKDLGVEINAGKDSYTNLERERLVDNIRMTIEDLNTKNDMQLQAVTRLTNERYESFQLARSIMKPIHDDKHNKAKAMVSH